MAKTALVTGASRGIGRAIDVALAPGGVDVALAARTVHSGEATLEHGQTVHKLDIPSLPGSIEETGRSSRDEAAERSCSVAT